MHAATHIRESGLLSMRLSSGESGMERSTNKRCGCKSSNVASIKAKCIPFRKICKKFLQILLYGRSFDIPSE